MVGNNTIVLIIKRNSAKTLIRNQFCFLIFMVLLSNEVRGQQLTDVVALNSALNETSGLIFLDQKLITHNDSGGEAALYEIDTLTGNIARTVIIANANNIDWEDICFDSNYIYIGDFGNNSGSRTNLRIYRLSIASYLTSSNDTVYVDTVQFNYADQTDFTPSSFSTNFDAEALISVQDSLYIFTKNWGDYRTNVYAVSKQPGSYSISRIDSLDAQGLITGGTYNADSNKIVLTGYTFTDPFIAELSQFSGNLFSNGLVERYTLDPTESIQVESITAFRLDQYYLTSEDNPTGSSTLMRLNSNAPNGLDLIEMKINRIYPNPANGRICIDGPDSGYNCNLYSGSGALVLCKKNLSSHTTIDVSGIDPGLYLLEIKWRGFTQRKKIILE
jgi:hypothetical protein